MGYARSLLGALCFMLLGFAAPAGATTVKVSITGTWDSVVDNASVTNGSITVGGAFQSTLIYDDATSDMNPSANIGEYDVPAASSDLNLVTGAYTFTLAAASLVGIEVDNNNAGQDGVFVIAMNYSVTGPPLGASTGSGYANPSLVDLTQTAHTSDHLIGLPWSISSYADRNFYFFIQVLGKGPNKYIELSGTITGLSLLPEPSTLALGAVAALLALARPRRSA